MAAPITLDRIRALRAEIETELSSAATPAALDAFRLRHLVRKGTIQQLVEALRDVPKEEKPALGRELNELKRWAEESFASMSSTSSISSAASSIDLTLPGRVGPIGHLHPVTQVLDEIVRIFERMGFSVREGPEIEDDYHNFEALNFPPDHPARDMQDTFFIDDPSGKVVLRTHTSPVQVRVMETEKPPIRVICPGRVYRNEAISPRSHCIFHQVEGLYVDEGVTFAELKGTLVAFAHQLFGNDLKYRFRPSFFPFTEPSAEMDITCFLCKGAGCRVCKQTGWLEILGCGMVDPAVYAHVGIDAEKYSGYAFGLGIDRLAMLKFGIDDIRLLWENDLRILEQF